MLYISSAIAALLPMFVYMLIIWRLDRYDRGPFGSVLGNYLWGAIGAIILAVVGSSLFSGFISVFIHNQSDLNQIQTIIVAPVVEELTKGVFLLVIVSRKKFDNITDGIVYGGAIGLGFGMTENFLYFIAFGNTLSAWFTIVFVRTLFSGVMHCVSTATFGAFLGYAKFKNLAYKLTFPIIGLITAIFIHSMWNFSVSFESTTLLGFLFMIFTVVIFIITFSITVIGERKIIYKELMEETASGLIPPEHLEILISSKRNKFGWVDESIRKLYIRAATTLAFRKIESKNSSGSSRDFYEKDVEYYRNFIQKLLSNTSLD
jgi:RsiW-degrading membrane proteinase PrsW (M82 family)